jgi:CRP/FNR family transcriptional regulator
MEKDCVCKGCSSKSDGNYASCIESVPIFSNLSPLEMIEISLITDAVSYEKGQMVYMAVDEGGKLYVLNTGRIKISRININGKEQVIRILGPGEFMGELSLFGSKPLTDNAEVIEATTMCVIKGDKLKELMGKYSSIAFKVMDELSKRLENAENLIEVISLNSVEQRLAQVLITLAGEGDQVDLLMKKGDLASQMGMSQETLSRKLTAFQDEGLIKLQGHKKIFILDRYGLEKILST